MLTIIGDVHGYHDSYLRIACDKPATVQVGDFGFDYACMSGMDYDAHKIIGGNHDNYDVIGDCPNYLGDFGTAIVGGVKFFFVRGEESVDAHVRTENVNWWRQEELDMSTAYRAIEAYSIAKPDVVITHGCPAELLPFFATNPAKTNKAPSRTAQLLDSMFAVHKPELWVFGHHHTTRNMKIGKTTFQCLNELDTMEI